MTSRGTIKTGTSGVRKIECEVGPDLTFVGRGIGVESGIEIYDYEYDQEPGLDPYVVDAGWRPVLRPGRLTIDVPLRADWRVAFWLL